MDGLMLGREQRAKSKEQTSGGEELLEESVLPVLYKRLVHQVSNVVISLNLFRPLTHSLVSCALSSFLCSFLYSLPLAAHSIMPTPSIHSSGALRPFQATLDGLVVTP
jgi:hypothetical protein